MRKYSAAVYRLHFLGASSAGSVEQHVCMSNSCARVSDVLRVLNKAEANCDPTRRARARQDKAHVLQGTLLERVKFCGRETRKSWMLQAEVLQITNRPCLRQ